MLYADITYETILSRMIARVEEWARGRGISIDTREGSLIRTALSPAAVELRLMYIELDEILNETFADTASREFLIRRCSERGITVKPATNAIRRGEFNMDVPIGSRFTLNRLNYTTVKRISAGAPVGLSVGVSENVPVGSPIGVSESAPNNAFEMECETPGIIGNQETGALIPINYINGLEWARLTDVLIPGEDEETTEHLRQRYFDSLESQAFGGNIADYKEKVNGLPGVGGCKVYPVWNGGGTVKVVLINSMFQKPSETLVEEVQTAIDPEQNRGMGLGLAPIGHVVTVEPVSETAIDIKTKLTYQSGWNWEAVKPYAEAVVDQYFLELSESWDKGGWEQNPNAALTVRISQIETRLLNTAGILDVQYTTLNGLAHNLTLDPDSIPKRGNVSDV